MMWLRSFFATPFLRCFDTVRMDLISACCPFSSLSAPQPSNSAFSRENAELLGCGALKELNGQHAEIKSMRTVSKHLRKGVAKKLLSHIIEEAKRRGYGRLSLETGSMEAFEPARRLYSSFGFTYCGP